MSTQQQYHDQLHALLSRRLAAPALAGAAGRMFSGDEIRNLAAALAGAVAELETRHQSASQHLQALLAGEQPEPWDGPGELAFMLYYLHHPSDAMRAAIDARPALKIAWEAMADVAPASPFTPDDVAKLRARVTDGEKVLCTAWGEILSFETYERLDPDWAWPIMNYVLNFLPRWLDENTTGLAPFVTADWTRPAQLVPGRDNKVRIALMGDWGTGPYTLTGMDSKDGPALEIMRALEALPEPPDYLIHLGDTYYSGTGAGRMPEHEERQNLLDVWKQHAAVARPGHCFALNGNHEMYGGLYGYQKVLADGLFIAQRGCSYFALEFGDWIIAGIDSSYFDTSVLYLDGSPVGTSSFSAVLGVGRTISISARLAGYVTQVVPVTVPGQGIDLSITMPEAKPAASQASAAPHPSSQQTAQAQAASSQPSQPATAASQTATAASRHSSAASQPAAKAKPLLGRVDIQVVPDTARIAVDGSNRGTGSFRSELEAGSQHTISASARGYASATGSITVPANSTVSHTIRLQARPIEGNYKIGAQAFVREAVPWDGGLIVAESVQELINEPLTLFGRALATASMTVRAFSSICSGLNDALPTMT